MNIIFKKIWQPTVIIFCILLAILIGIFCNIFHSSAVQELKEEIFSVQENFEFYDEYAYGYSLDKLNELIYNELAIQEKAHKLAQAAREMGWPEQCQTVIDAKATWHNAEIKIQFYSPIYNLKYEEANQILWDKRMEEYPVATTIWQYMQSLGWSDYVCAGVIGNMMAEAGGQTLKIQPNIYNTSKNYYGICQWSKKYYPKVQGKDLTAQLNFLSDTIKYEIDTYGRLYKSNFNFHDFLNLTNEKDVALAFAKSYERCDSRYYAIRQENATKALNYFNAVN